MLASRNNCQDLQVVRVTPCKSTEGGPPLFELLLSAPGWDFRPGQFVMVRPPDWGLDLVWGRPLSIADISGEGLRLLVQAVGRGTRGLSGLRPGQVVTVWGPLGNSFAMEPDTPTLLLAGGIGIAPFVGYARKHPRPENIALLFGHRLPAQCYPLGDFAGLSDVKAVRERNSEELALFVERLGQTLRGYARAGLVLACGPEPFLRTVRKLALALKARVQLSLENRMACGVGACLGCVAKNGQGKLVQTCTHGPVFWAEDVFLSGEAPDVSASKPDATTATIDGSRS